MCDTGSIIIATNSATSASAASNESPKPALNPQCRPTSPFPEIPDVSTIDSADLIRTTKSPTPTRSVLSPAKFKEMKDLLETTDNEDYKELSKSVVEMSKKTVTQETSRDVAVSEDIIHERPVSPFPAIPDVTQIDSDELLAKTSKDERICRSVSPFPEKQKEMYEKNQESSVVEDAVLSTPINRQFETKQTTYHNFNILPTPFHSKTKSQFNAVVKPLFQPFTVEKQETDQKQEKTIVQQETKNISQTSDMHSIKFPPRPVSPYPVFIPKSPVPDKKLILEREESTLKTETVTTSTVQQIKQSAEETVTNKEEKLVKCTKAPEAVIGAKPIFGQLDINNELKKAFGIVNKQEQNVTKTSHIKNKISKFNETKQVKENVSESTNNLEEEKKVKEHIPSDFISKNLIFDIDDNDKYKMPQSDLLSSKAEETLTNVETELQKTDIAEESVIKQKTVLNEVEIQNSLQNKKVQNNKQNQSLPTQQKHTKNTEISSVNVSTEKETSSQISAVQESLSITSETQLETNEENETYKTPPVQSLIKTFEQSTMPVMKYKQIRETTNSHLSSNSSMERFFSVNNKENVSPVPDTSAKYVQPMTNGDAKHNNLYYVSQTSVENRVFLPTKSTEVNENYQKEEENVISESCHVKKVSEEVSSSEKRESSSTLQMSNQMSSSFSSSSSQAVHIQHLGGLQQSGKNCPFVFFFGF